MKYAASLAFALLALFAGAAAEEAAEIRTPPPLEPYARFASKVIDESSGLVKSRLHEGAYWTHNDSGDEARLFAVTRDGALAGPAWAGERGLSIGGAVNIDWEDIATDDQGFLYIGAFGNNGNARRDLAVYVVPEPHPAHQSQTRVLKTLPFAYPDQTAFPPAQRNFDCEALFHARGKLYFLTKRRSDTLTKLYRLDTKYVHKVNTLTLIDSHDVGGMVTAADALPDGGKIAVLTYESVWIFERPADSDNYLAGLSRRLPIRAGQCEAICWDGPDTLIVTNEQGGLFEIEL